jgi:hypothetical protein
MIELETLWDDWLRMVCYQCDPYDHIHPARGIPCVRDLCAGFLEMFPLVGDGSDDPAVDAVRWLCETILEELDWEVRGEKPPPGAPPADSR